MSNYQTDEELFDVIREVIYQSNQPDYHDYLNSKEYKEYLSDFGSVELQINKDFTFEDKK